jgi:hypothetical protein
MENKRDLSISMARANIVVLFISIPVVVLQFALFSSLHGTERLAPTWGTVPLIIAILLGILLHELIHGISWMFFGQKPFSTIRFGFQWQTLTPYAHLTEPVDVGAYRIGAFMPGLLLGVVTYLSSLASGDGNLFWFSLAHTSAAGGDWLILWLIRSVKNGTLVEDHPTHAGCYVIES